jgi:hypothetical protein
MGRRAHKPDSFHRRQVEAMAGYGVPELDIARVVGIDSKTLRKHYRDELDTGQIKATAKVAEFLFRKATTDGSQAVTAAIFWMKSRAGWKEPSVHELSGRDGGPIEISEHTPRQLARAILQILGSVRLEEEEETGDSPVAPRLSYRCDASSLGSQR